jgi:hypothetical protein
VRSPGDWGGPIRSGPGTRTRPTTPDAPLGFTTCTPETLFFSQYCSRYATSSLSVMSQDCLVLGSVESAAGWEIRCVMLD